MKPFLIVTNIITAAIAVYFFAASKIPDGIQQPTLPNGMNPDCERCKDYSGIRVPGLISVKFARKISEDYAKDPGKKYVTKEGILTEHEDARSLHFSFDKIKNYIWKIDSLFCGKNCQNLQLGIRFYYAKYPDSATCAEYGVTIKKVYGNKHTLFMVPTYFNGEQHVDFDPFSGIYTDICRPTPLSELIQRKDYLQKMPAVILIPPPDGDGDVDNQGGLRPPPAGTGTFLGY